MTDEDETMNGDGDEWIRERKNIAEKVRTTAMHRIHKSQIVESYITFILHGKVQRAIAGGWAPNIDGVLNWVTKNTRLFWRQI